MFSVEITERQYDISDHPGAVYKTAAFRIAEEIAHHMYCSENKRLYLTDEEVEDISKALQQDPSLRELHGNDWNAFELVKRNVGLCSFWKAMLNDAILPDGFHSHSQEAQLSHIRNQMFLSIKL